MTPSPGRRLPCDPKKPQRPNSFSTPSHFKLLPSPAFDEGPPRATESSPKQPQHSNVNSPSENREDVTFPPFSGARPSKIEGYGSQVQRDNNPALSNSAPFSFVDAPMHNNEGFNCRSCSAGPDVHFSALSTYSSGAKRTTEAGYNAYSPAKQCFPTSELRTPKRQQGYVHEHQAPSESSLREINEQGSVSDAVPIDNYEFDNSLEFTEENNITDQQPSLIGPLLPELEAILKDLPPLEPHYDYVPGGDAHAILSYFLGTYMVTRHEHPPYYINHHSSPEKHFLLPNEIASANGISSLQIEMQGTNAPFMMQVLQTTTLTLKLTHSSGSLSIANWNVKHGGVRKGEEATENTQDVEPSALPMTYQYIERRRFRLDYEGNLSIWSVHTVAPKPFPITNNGSNNPQHIDNMPLVSSSDVGGTFSDLPLLTSQGNVAVTNATERLIETGEFVRESTPQPCVVMNGDRLQFKFFLRGARRVWSSHQTVVGTDGSVWGTAKDAYQSTV